MPKPPALYTFEDTTSLAKELRKYVTQAQNESVERHGVFRVAVVGTPTKKLRSKADMRIVRRKPPKDPRDRLAG